MMTMDPSPKSAEPESVVYIRRRTFVVKSHMFTHESLNRTIHRTARRALASELKDRTYIYMSVAFEFIKQINAIII